MLSEFGWQSDAPWFSIKAVTPPEDWDTWAPGAQYRQRWNTDGTAIKTAQMSKVFGGLPTHSFRSSAADQRAALYSDWIYLRQMHQSICYDFTISMMRRKMRDPARLSAGTLYWQLNDVWQGASWWVARRDAAPAPAPNALPHLPSPRSSFQRTRKCHSRGTPPAPTTRSCPGLHSPYRPGPPSPPTPPNTPPNLQYLPTPQVLH
jgi:hypothetical protein